MTQNACEKCGETKVWDRYTMVCQSCADFAASRRHEQRMAALERERHRELVEALGKLTEQVGKVERELRALRLEGRSWHQAFMGTGSTPAEP